MNARLSSALTMKPQDGVYQSMCLHFENNNNILTSSSSSSSCSSSSSSSSTLSSSSLSSSSPSPDSTYSLSSLDVELSEGIIGSKAATSEDDSGIQSPDCRPNEDANSVSIYLDARDEAWHMENDDQDKVSIQNQTHENDNAAVDAELRRRGSADSSATEEQLFSSSEDEEGEDEEDSFLSLRSADVVMRKQSEPAEIQMCNSTIKPSVGPLSELHQEAFQNSMDRHNEEGQMCISTKKPNVGLESELHQEAFQDSVDHLNEEGQMCSSTMRPNVGLVSELNKEDFQDSVDHLIEEGQMCSSMRTAVSELHQDRMFYRDKSKVQKSTKWADVDFGIELHHSTCQEKHDQTLFSYKNPEVGSVSQEVVRDSVVFHNKENQIQTKSPNVHLLSKLHQEAQQTTVDLSTEQSPSQPSADSVLSQTASPSVSQDAPPSSALQNIKDPPCSPKSNIVQSTNDHPDPSHTRSPKTKGTKVELKRFSRPNLKDVKAKVISRTTSSTRPASTDHSQSAAASERDSSPTKSRATNRRERGDNGVDKNHAESVKARLATPIKNSNSNIKSTQMVKKHPSETPGAFGVTNGCHVQTGNSNVMETVKDERDSHSEDVVKQSSRDGDVDQTASSDLRPLRTVTRVPNRGCVSAGVRAAPLSGVPKMRMIDSKPASCSSAPSWKSPQNSVSSKLPVSLSSSSLSSSTSENKGVAHVMKSEDSSARPSSSSQGKSNKPSAGIHNKPNTPTKPNTTGQKATAQVIQSKTTHKAPQRGGSVRPSRSSTTVCPSSRGSWGTRPVRTHTEEEEEKKNRSILQLRSFVARGNRRLEALAVVIQHIFTERDGALKQKKELSIQLKNLREELAQSVVCCERLESEKASVCAKLDQTVLALQQQHQAELSQLEERLGDFYSAEWDKAHQVYQDEADRCTALMRQQVEEVKSKQEALRNEQESEHSRQIEELRHGYESMLAELQKCHERDKQELDNTVKSSEAALNERIERLMEENKALSECLRETEEKWKAIGEKSQRDSRVVYLEQELESLKVVLDIKNNQLHQQDKKLMQMDKLIDSNVKLEEFVTRLQQENEDYKARMDKHAELSRQLSTEQVMLQQTLQKESKANKRLSMENEELLWKLHNGLSPRNSASFPSSPPISPR